MVPWSLANLALLGVAPRRSEISGEPLGMRLHGRRDKLTFCSPSARDLAAARRIALVEQRGVRREERDGDAREPVVKLVEQNGRGRRRHPTG